MEVGGGEGGRVLSARIVARTTGRILRQLRHDPRTVALVVVVPVVLLTLIYFMWEGQPLFDRVALIMLGVFPFVIMFLLTNIAVLRERTSGTLERLFTTPISRFDLIFSYGVAFGLTYSVKALTEVGAHVDATGAMWSSLGVVLGVVLAALALGALTLRRRTA